MESLLRKMIQAILREDAEILTEPDTPSDEEEQEEASVAAGVAGVITPLGTGPNYPDGSPKRRTPAAAAGSAFGNAKPYKPSKKKKKN